MKNIMIVAILSCFCLSSYAKEKRNPIANDPAKDAFFSGTSNKLAEEEQGPQKAIVKVGECLKYLKEGENFWTKYETEVVKVEEIGKATLKLRRFLFINVRSNRWAYDDTAFSLRFPEQTNYEIMECPKPTDQLSFEEIEKIKKK